VVHKASGPFSCFAHLISFSAVPRASGPVFIFCAQTRFLQYRARLVLLSCFALRYSFSMVPTASVPVFLFCAPGLVSGDTEGIRSCFSGFTLHDSFSAVPRASLPVFTFCASGLVFGFRVSGLVFTFCPWALGPVFMFSTPGLVFSGIEGVGSRFHDLRTRSHFRRIRGCPLPFSCFPLSDTFSVVPGWRWVLFSCFARQTRFRRYRGRRIPFSYFAHPDLFSAVPRASGPDFIFCAQTRF
jgi:hypothetical protein